MKKEYVYLYTLLTLAQWKTRPFRGRVSKIVQMPNQARLTVKPSFGGLFRVWKMTQ